MAKEDRGIFDKFGVCLSVLLSMIAIGGVACALATTTGCDFVLYEPAVVPLNVTEEVPRGFENLTSVNIGLFEYDPDGLGCRSISDDFDELGWQMRTARVGNALAVICSGVAMLLHLWALFLCRFPCSRIIISGLFCVAFITQALTFFIFATNVCDPNFKNAPYPCSPDSACYVSISATVLFLIASCFTCCIPKPTPVVTRVRENLKNDQTDSCWILCAKGPPKEEEEEEIEKGAVVVEQDEDETSTEKEEDEDGPKENDVPVTGEVAVPVEDEQLKALREQEARAAIVVALAAARHGKQEEIEKQLEMLTKYKNYLSEEEYEAKVAKLLHALPDPETFDTCTKTELLVEPPAKEEEEKEEEGESEEEYDVSAFDMEEEEVAEEKKKQSKVGSAIKTSGHAIASGFTAVKKAVTPGSSKAAKAPADVP